MNLSCAELRRAFLDFFASKQHQEVNSSSLVPGNDPTLLFTNAGMNQFKDVFLGAEQRGYSRAASSQRCVRAGGKHNDLENVGYTARHHTFFEMLGNFSFGDYFKRDAIQYAWEFLTVTLQLPKEKLWVTVFEEDDEAADIWINEIGVNPERLSRIGAKDNFWSMGDTGPCGPCTEIFYDHGEHIWGGPPGTPEEDGDRYIEIWNLVFMQFNRHADGTMEPLPKPSVDTGMGLERIAAIMQGVHSNYEIDIFQNLIKDAAEVIGTTDLENKSLRVVADHIRSCGFLVSDGVVPSNEGRGYVLRRIIRRAIRHGNKLGAKDVFFFKLVASLCRQMGDAYPEINERREMIEKVLKTEEEQFAKTLERGLHILETAVAELDDNVIPGDLVFKLYDTYGFPVDLTADVAREKELTVDEQGFEAAMEEQRARAQKASQFGTDYNAAITSDISTDFLGYEKDAATATVVELFVEGQSVTEAKDGDLVTAVLDQTPFYAESGGQVGDTGLLITANGQVRVQDTLKLDKAFAHRGQLTGALKVGEQFEAKVDHERRDAIRLNHTGTHLLHAALRQVLGEHVTQKGSLVDAEKLRFDFSHFEAVTEQELAEIEDLVNQEIRKNHDLTTQLMDLEEAKESGAMALFGEKYDEKVRVVSMGDFSVELCGGTHAKRSGDIGLLKITSESGIAAGVRRIEAVTGAEAMAFVRGQAGALQSVAQLVKSDVAGVPTKVSQLMDKTRQLEKELEKVKQQMASQAGSDLTSQAQDIKGIKVIIANLPDAEPKSLRGTVDELKNQMGSGIIVLGTSAGEKVSLIAGVTKDLTNQVKAGELVNFVAQQVGGKGGGRPDMAQAGGSQPENLEKSLNSVTQWLTDKL